MTEQTKKSLTKGDIRSTYWRSTFLLGSFNFERMQAMGFCVSMIPAIKRLYSKKKIKQRHKTPLRILQHPTLGGIVYHRCNRRDGTRTREWQRY